MVVKKSRKFPRFVTFIYRSQKECRAVARSFVTGAGGGGVGVGGIIATAESTSPVGGSGGIPSENFQISIPVCERGVIFQWKVYEGVTLSVKNGI